MGREKRQKKKRRRRKQREKKKNPTFFFFLSSSPFHFFLSPPPTKILSRGRDVASVIEQYTKFVKPAFDSFVAPSRKHADVVIPWGREESNVVAIDLISQHIRSKLQQPDLRRLYHNLEVVPSNFQVRGMHTHRPRRARRRTQRLRVLRGQAAAARRRGGARVSCPSRRSRVTTPTGATYVGVDFAKKLCGVSVIRSGESMENALRACCKGIKIGKILVHRAAGDRLRRRRRARASRS